MHRNLRPNRDLEQNTDRTQKIIVKYGTPIQLPMILRGAVILRLCQFEGRDGAASFGVIPWLLVTGRRDVEQRRR